MVATLLLAIGIGVVGFLSLDDVGRTRATRETPHPGHRGTGEHLDGDELGGARRPQRRAADRELRRVVPANAAELADAHKAYDAVLPPAPTAALAECT